MPISIWDGAGSQWTLLHPPCESTLWGFVSTLSVVFLWLFLCPDGHSKLLSPPCLLKEMAFAQDRSDHGCRCATPVLHHFSHFLRKDVRRHILEGNGLPWVIYRVSGPESAP